LLRFSIENLWVSAIVTLGLWPLIAARFHNLSLLAFLGNLLLVPAMELALLPLAMSALVVSAICSAAAPDVWAERLVYGALELGLHAWVFAVHVLDRLGGSLLLRLDLQWSAWGFLGYYLALLAATRSPSFLLTWFGHRKGRNTRFPMSGD
jgi:hypothetical protein